MGRHSASYIAAQQVSPIGRAPSRRTAGYVGRVGLLAVALGIGAGLAGATAVAGADTTASNASDTAAVSSAVTGPGSSASAVSPDRPSGKHSAESRRQAARAEASRAESDDSDATTDADTAAAERGDDPSEPPATAPAPLRPLGTVAADDDPAVTAEEVTAADVADIAVPSPDDQATTEYGDIGKWMLQANGEIADYGGLPYNGKTVLETVNVIIVDSTSTSSLEATWRLNAAMRRAGFPPRLIHSTGFRGLIDNRRYRQQPRGLLVGYSDDFFLRPNNHGRIFGPDPVESSGGYVWSGSFSTEEFVFYNGLPRHGYLSSNVARDALAARLVASGRARLGGVADLANSYETDSVTTGDHDGYAVVLILTDPRAVGATAASALVSGGRSCPADGGSADRIAAFPCAPVGQRPLATLS